jgi:hypothetical protein
MTAIAAAVARGPGRSPAPTPGRTGPSTVARRTTPKIQRGAACACGGGCPRCRKNQQMERRPTAGGGSVLAATGTAAPSIALAVTRRSGAALDPGVRHDAERRLGHDFGNVRVHSGPEVSEAAAG